MPIVPEPLPYLNPPKKRPIPKPVRIALRTLFIFAVAALVVIVAIGTRLYLGWSQQLDAQKMLHRLSHDLEQYLTLNDGHYPASLSQLRVEGSDLFWSSKIAPSNYLGNGFYRTDLFSDPDIIILTHRTWVAKGTGVIFADGRVEWIPDPTLPRAVAASAKLRSQWRASSQPSTQPYLERPFNK